MFKLVVLSCVVALAAAKPSAIAPWGLGLAGPLVAPAAVAPLGLAGHGALWGAPALAAYNYRGPVSLAPGQPASILAADGRPLDTLSVNLDRAAHYTARAVDNAGHGLHLLKKRSAVLGAPLAISHTARIDLPAARLVAPGHVGALGWPAGVGGLGWHGAAAPWGVAPLGLGHAAGLGHLW